MLTYIYRDNSFLVTCSSTSYADWSDTNLQAILWTLLRHFLIKIKYTYIIQNDQTIRNSKLTCLFSFDAIINRFHNPFFSISNKTFATINYTERFYRFSQLATPYANVGWKSGNHSWSISLKSPVWGWKAAFARVYLTETRLANATISALRRTPEDYTDKDVVSRRKGREVSACPLSLTGFSQFRHPQFPFRRDVFLSHQFNPESRKFSSLFGGRIFFVSRFSFNIRYWPRKKFVGVQNSNPRNFS